MALSIRNAARSSNTGGYRYKRDAMPKPMSGRMGATKTRGASAHDKMRGVESCLDRQAGRILGVGGEGIAGVRT